MRVFSVICLVTTILGIACGKVVPPAEFCVRRYQEMVDGHKPITQQGVQACMETMKKCSSEELGEEFNAHKRKSAYYCTKLPDGSACKKACLEFDNDVKQGKFNN